MFWKYKYILGPFAVVIIQHSCSQRNLRVQICTWCLVQSSYCCTTDKIFHVSALLRPFVKPCKSAPLRAQPSCHSLGSLEKSLLCNNRCCTAVYKNLPVLPPLEHLSPPPTTPSQSTSSAQPLGRARSTHWRGEGNLGFLLHGHLPWRELDAVSERQKQSL